MRRRHIPIVTVALLALSVPPMAAQGATGRAPADSTRVVALDSLAVTTKRRLLSLDGAFRQATSLAALDAPTGVQGRRRSILVEGAMATPSACWRLRGAGVRQGSDLMLNIEAQPWGTGCIDAMDAFTYKVSIRRLPAGTYRLRIVHTWRGGAVPSSLAMDTTVAVQ